MELNQKITHVASNLMEIITKGYQWYIDTPEQPFEYSEGSIWLLNPETEQWMLELTKSGELWYNYETTDSFSKYLNMERHDFESFIKTWMEDVLKRGVVSTVPRGEWYSSEMEDVLKRGVVSTGSVCGRLAGEMEDVLNRGVSSTIPYKSNNSCGVEDVLKRGVVSIIRNEINWDDEIKDVLEKGVTTNVKYFAQDT